MQKTEETQVPSLGWEDPLEKGMATHSSILAWRFPWTEEPGRLLIAYAERCRIYDLQRRFSFGTRDQAWSLKSFCVAEF